MANFLVLLDSNADRRHRYLEQITPQLSPVPGLVTHRCQCGEMATVWAAQAQAPVSYVEDATSAAVILGDALLPDDCDRTSAKALLTHWQTPAPAAFDGFHVAISYTPQQGLIVGADLLGFFPVYYYQGNGVVLVASSPELIRLHPSYSGGLDLSGLVGILLLRVLMNDRSLWQGIQRLGPGNLLHVKSPAHAPQETAQYRPPVQRDHVAEQGYDNLSFDEHVELLDHTFRRALIRQTAASKTQGCLLSGGLDSRMLAGYLVQERKNVTALTIGQSNDLEMHCARRVAQTAEFEHRTLDLCMDHYPAYANLVLQWEHLAAGCNGINGMGWGLAGQLPNFPSRLVTGLTVDLVLAREPVSEPNFSAAFEPTNRAVGLQPAQLEQLLKSDQFSGILDSVIASSREDFLHYSDCPDRRAWLYRLYHSGRFCNGMLAWRLSFSAWPVLVMLDQRLLRLMASLPTASIAHRRLQKALVRRKFPDLAQLPLDRNSFDLSPLACEHPNTLLRRLARRSRKLQQQLGHDRRFYYRMINVNNPGWRSIRQQAEAFRPLAETFFDRSLLAELLPRADQTLKLEQNIILQ